MILDEITDTPLLLGLHLLGLGCRVDSYTDAVKTLSMFNPHHHHCDLILLDVGMPYMNRYHFYHRIKQIGKVARFVLGLSFIAS
jgi:CheY-like chemotaxis protein